MGEIDERDQYIEQLIQQGDMQQNKINQLSSGLSGYDQSTQSPNLIHYQIDCSDLLERLEHFYKGEYLTTLSREEGGDVVWKVPTDQNKVPLNEYGVSSYMEIISKYLDKNTVLSNYSEMRINEILADLGEELILFTLCNYEKMGMDNYEKKTKFRLLVTTTLHIIESTYRRSLQGKTFEDVNQSRIVIPSDMRFGGMPQNPQKKKSGFGFLKNWL